MFSQDMITLSTDDSSKTQVNRKEGEPVTAPLLSGFHSLLVLPGIQQILFVLEVKQTVHGDFIIACRIVRNLSSGHINVDLVRIELSALRLIQLIEEEVLVSVSVRYLVGSGRRIRCWADFRCRMPVSAALLPRSMPVDSARRSWRREKYFLCGRMALPVAWSWQS